MNGAVDQIAGLRWTRITTAAGALLLGCLLTYSVLRGTPAELKDYALPMYMVNYHDGLIRRGMIGHIFSWFVDQKSASSVRTAIYYSYLLLEVLFLGGLLAWCWFLQRRRGDYLLFTLFAVFASAQFVPTLAFDIGYLDIFDYLLLLVAGIAFARRNFTIVAAAALVGPFIHETFIFCWFALGALVLWEKASAGRIALLCLPLVSSAVLYLAASSEATTAQVVLLAIPQAEKPAAYWMFLGQSPAATFEILLWKFRHNVLNVVIAAIFYTMPALFILGMYSFARRSRRDGIFLAFAAFAPLSVLLFAWDLSRFIVGACFFAMFAVLYVESVRPAGRGAGPVVLSCAVVAWLLVQVPFTYAFFEHSTVADRYPLGMRSWPLSRITLAGSAFFSRAIGPQFVGQVGNEAPPGKVWYVEESAWRGAWMRRSDTNTFDAVMTMGGSVVTFEAKVERDGNTIIVRRDHGSDGSGRMDYLGELKGNLVSGTYLGGHWTAVVLR